MVEICQVEFEGKERTVSGRLEASRSRRIRPISTQEIIGQPDYHMIMQDGSDAVRLTAGAADEIGKERISDKEGEGFVGRSGPLRPWEKYWLCRGTRWPRNKGPFLLSVRLIMKHA